MIKNSRFTETITVIRSSPTIGSTDDGTVIQGPTTTFQCLASVQPLSGFDQVNLPEENRSKNWLYCYSDTQLNTVSTYPSIPADLVLRANGMTYKVTGCEPWDSSTMSIGPYWRARMCLDNG